MLEIGVLADILDVHITRRCRQSQPEISGQCITSEIPTHLFSTRSSRRTVQTIQSLPSENFVCMPFSL